MIKACGLFFVLALSFGCSSNQGSIDEDVIRAGMLHPQIPLTPRGRTLDPASQAVVQWLIPGKSGQRSGLKPNDLIVALNGKQINSIADYDVLTKFASKKSSLVVDRDGVKKTISIDFDEQKPRGGIEIEPLGIPVIRAASPMIATIHSREMTVHAQASVNKARDEIHVNFIIESSITAPVIQARLSVYDIDKKKLLLNGKENLEALGSRPLLVTRKVHTDGDFKSAIRVALNISNNHFVFEFQ